MHMLKKWNILKISNIYQSQFESQQVLKASAVQYVIQPYLLTDWHSSRLTLAIGRPSCCRTPTHLWWGAAAVTGPRALHVFWCCAAEEFTVTAPRVHQGASISKELVWWGAAEEIPGPADNWSRNWWGDASASPVSDSVSGLNSTQLKKGKTGPTVRTKKEEYRTTGTDQLYHTGNLASVVDAHWFQCGSGTSI
jgi:hypothetical protein